MALSGLKEGTVTSKMNLDLNLGGKSLSVGGSCNLKRDEVIQLSLVAMGFMEVGRLEFTPQYMMMVNRMGREYVKVDYADVPYLQQAGVDFYTLQALFWSDVFVPGQEGRWQEQDFTISKNQESTILTSKAGSLLQCQFVVDLLTGLIRNTSIVEEIYDGEELSDTMIVFCGLSNQKLDQALLALKKSGAGPFPYKAILTPTNQHWLAKDCLAELKREHEYMTARGNA